MYFRYLALQEADNDRRVYLPRITGRVKMEDLNVISAGIFFFNGIQSDQWIGGW